MKDGREYVRELPDQKGQRFYVDDPFSATKTVQLRTRGDFERRIDTIFVDLTYDDETNNYRQTNSIALVARTSASSTGRFPVVDERAGKIGYKRDDHLQGRHRRRQRRQDHGGHDAAPRRGHRDAVGEADPRPDRLGRRSSWRRWSSTTPIRRTASTSARASPSARARPR